MKTLRYPPTSGGINLEDIKAPDYLAVELAVSPRAEKELRCAFRRGSLTR
jgi:hypothetical protein